VHERHLCSSKSALTRFGSISWVQLRWNQGDHLSSTIPFLSFFAIKPSCHFYLYFTVRNFIDFVLRFIGYRFRWNQPSNSSIYLFGIHLFVRSNHQYFKQLFDT
jgi:hypothetical protein